MKTRLQLQALLEELLGSDNVYFQPPPDCQLIYPCIIYRFLDEENKYADDIQYMINKQYMITVIDADPDTKIPDKIRALKFSGFDRFYISNNLNHYVYTLYF